MAACIRVGVAAAVLVLALGCDDRELPADAAFIEDASNQDADVSTATIVDLGFFGRAYDDARVCVEATCGVLGVDESLRVEPAIQGPSFRLVVTLREVELEMERDFSADLQAIGAGPDATSHRMAIALTAREDGCGIYVTNHVIGQTAVTSTPPMGSALETLCGPFAALEE